MFKNVTLLYFFFGLVITIYIFLKKNKEKTIKTVKTSCINKLFYQFKAISALNTLKVSSKETYK